MFEYIKAAPEPQESIEIDLLANVVLTPESLKDKFSRIDSMNDKDIFILVQDYYETILNIIFDSNETSLKRFFIDLFTNAKFVLALTQAMYTITPSDISKKRLNKMCYDYLVISKHDESESYISGLLMSLAKTINRDKIPLLCTVPLSEDLASMIALSRYSSEKEVINVKRLNRVLMNQPSDSLTEQKIVDIYLTLFDHVLPLFTGVMLDVQSPSNMSQDAMEIYGLITLAALDILNELPMTDIKKGLILFDEDRYIQYSDKPIRINLESITSSDYPRILSAIDSLKAEGVIIRTR